MAKLQTGRFERLSARTYGIKGPGALVDLDETVLGVVLLERQGGFESHLIQDWQTFSTRNSRGAVAGQFSYILISNPVDSNRIVVVDSWQRNNAIVHEVFITRGVPPGFVAGTVGQPIDTRIPASTEPTARCFVLNSAIGGFGSIITMPATAEIIRFPVMLGPDGSLVFRAGNVNTALTLSTRWAERDAAPFEV